MEIDQKTFLRKLFKIYSYQFCPKYLNILKNLNTSHLSEYFGYDIVYSVSIQYKNRVRCIDDFPYENQKFIQRYPFFMNYEKQKVYKYHGAVLFNLGSDFMLEDTLSKLNLKIKKFEIKTNYFGYKCSFLKFQLSNLRHRTNTMFLDYMLWIVE